MEELNIDISDRIKEGIKPRIINYDIIPEYHNNTINDIFIQTENNINNVNEQIDKIICENTKNIQCIEEGSSRLDLNSEEYRFLRDVCCNITNGDNNFLNILETHLKKMNKNEKLYNLISELIKIFSYKSYINNHTVEVVLSEHDKSFLNNIKQNLIILIDKADLLENEFNNQMDEIKKNNKKIVNNISLEYNVNKNLTNVQNTIDSFITSKYSCLFIENDALFNKLLNDKNHLAGDIKSLNTKIINYKEGIETDTTEQNNLIKEQNELKEIIKNNNNKLEDIEHNMGDIKKNHHETNKKHIQEIKTIEEKKGNELNNKIDALIFENNQNIQVIQIKLNKKENERLDFIKDKDTYYKNKFKSISEGYINDINNRIILLEDKNTINNKEMQSIIEIDKENFYDIIKGENDKFQTEILDIKNKTEIENSNVQEQTNELMFTFKEIISPIEIKLKHLEEEYNISIKQDEQNYILENKDIIDIEKNKLKLKLNDEFTNKNINIIKLNEQNLKKINKLKEETSNKLILIDTELESGLKSENELIILMNNRMNLENNIINDINTINTNSEQSIETININYNDTKKKINYDIDNINTYVYNIYKKSDIYLTKDRDKKLQINKLKNTIENKKLFNNVQLKNIDKSIILKHDENIKKLQQNIKKNNLKIYSIPTTLKSNKLYEEIEKNKGELNYMNETLSQFEVGTLDVTLNKKIIESIDLEYNKIINEEITIYKELKEELNATQIQHDLAVSKIMGELNEQNLYITDKKYVDSFKLSGKYTNYSMDEKYKKLETEYNNLSVIIDSDNNVLFKLSNNINTTVLKIEELNDLYEQAIKLKDIKNESIKKINEVLLTRKSKINTDKRKIKNKLYDKYIDYYSGILNENIYNYDSLNNNMLEYNKIITDIISTNKHMLEIKKKKLNTSIYACSIEKYNKLNEIKEDLKHSKKNYTHEQNKNINTLKEGYDKMVKNNENINTILKTIDEDLDGHTTIFSEHENIIRDLLKKIQGEHDNYLIIENNIKKKTNIIKNIKNTNILKTQKTKKINEYLKQLKENNVKELNNFKNLNIEHINTLKVAEKNEIELQEAEINRKNELEISIKQLDCEYNIVKEKEHKIHDVKKQLEQSKEELNNTTTKIEQNEIQLDNIKENIKTMDTLIKGYIEETGKNKNNIELYKIKNTELKIKIESSSKALKEFNKNMEDEKYKHTKYKIEFDELLLDVNELNTKNSYLKKSYLQNKKKNESIGEKNLELKHKSNELLGVIHTLDSSKKKMESDIILYETKLHEAQRTSINIKSDIDNIINDINDKRGILSMKTEEFYNLKAQYDKYVKSIRMGPNSKEQMLQIKTEELHNIINNIEEFEKNIYNIKKDYEVKTKMAEEYKISCNDIQNKLETEKNVYTEIETEYKEFKGTYDNKMKELNLLKGQYDKYNHIFNNSTNEMAKMNENINNYKRSNIELEENIKNKTKECNTMKTEIVENETKIHNFKKMNDKLIKIYESKALESETANAKLHSVINDYKHRDKLNNTTGLEYKASILDYTEKTNKLNINIKNTNNLIKESNIKSNSLLKYIKSNNEKYNNCKKEMISLGGIYEEKKIELNNITDTNDNLSKELSIIIKHMKIRDEEKTKILFDIKNSEEIGQTLKNDIYKLKNDIKEYKEKLNIKEEDINISKGRITNEMTIKMENLKVLYNKEKEIEKEYLIKIESLNEKNDLKKNEIKTIIDTGNKNRKEYSIKLKSLQEKNYFKQGLIIKFENEYKTYLQYINDLNISINKLSDKNIKIKSALLSDNNEIETIESYINKYKGRYEEDKIVLLQEFQNIRTIEYNNKIN
tara:strand:+ start:3388 stop:8859 length:5472 start_codon:yes stop_codon:yes gene_type:complete